MEPVQYAVIGYVMVFGIFWLMIKYQEEIMAYFHLIDERKFLTNRETSMLNELMGLEDVSVHAASFHNPRNYFITIRQGGAYGESFENTIKNESFSKAVREAHDWAKRHGLIK